MWSWEDVLRKMSEGLGTLSDGLRKVSDGLRKVAHSRLFQHNPSFSSLIQVIPALQFNSSDTSYITLQSKADYKTKVS